ncbi:MAG: Rieske 2Fe-2S family protein [uncultured bacterium]|jgi:nitrite reductase/ring-hydroxylating ferredoxin subunit|uniref:Ferredoxin, Rieske superfamily n=1 Tax=Geobacter sulfurreducens (strain ATCC 51573 / DSM 12127 / PCA) TaxID=243231 RepID=Q747M7_GEOSL|nr:Rieske (2Fe-2S) protein [Geobacter sulfurreducens]EKD59295.1 MAG: Rieske 2Fe-2S family protein [uncultured bacterium]AAR36629.1 ferredoxin, Rieske superfamily [Geobacter sulfurreducens PCA]ADI85982.1 ferredoxin, Rieske superfamily [Geobacter sulfurreducens KN400]AJY69465.1 2Fe-2S ferredoxin [Geobacter sulfurreducens]QVW35019.1 Rieske (2Fe-2S) protein [Geobacter sulfurreducens]
MVFAAKVSEIPDFGKKVVTVNGQEILLVKAKGQVYACETECPHQGAPLSGALVKDAEHLSCQRHGYRFNLKTGACKEFPEYTLKIYPSQVVGEDVMVEI